ncbi:MAG: TadE/TadG family type IV pilus assembly protein [Pseudomonadota bacterium]
MNTRMQRRAGAATVEFALVVVAFMIVLLGIIEMGRTLFLFNSAAEATRRGARTATVVALNSPDILLDMQRIMPDLTAEQVSISYLPANCTTDTCAYVQVSLLGYTVRPMFWDMAPIVMPPFLTTLPAESLGTD